MQNMQRVHSRAWVCALTQTKMRKVDDIFRGFLKSPDGGVEIEIELIFNDGDRVLNVDIYEPDDLIQED